MGEPLTDEEIATARSWLRMRARYDKRTPFDGARWLATVDALRAERDALASALDAARRALFTLVPAGKGKQALVCVACLGESRHVDGCAVPGALRLLGRPPEEVLHIRDRSRWIDGAAFADAEWRSATGIEAESREAALAGLEMVCPYGRREGAGDE